MGRQTYSDRFKCVCVPLMIFELINNFNNFYNIKSIVLRYLAYSPPVGHANWLTGTDAYMTDVGHI